MRLTALMAIAACAPGCQLVFSLDDPPNLIAHVPAADETINENDITLADVTIDTTQAAVTVGVPMGVVELSVIDQEGEGPSMALLRGRAITISGELRIEGSRPLVILADTITIGSDGSIDASAIDIKPGPGGHKSGENGLGEGGPGGRSGDPLPTGSDSGGGGGAFGAIGAAPGAPVGDDCRAPQTGGIPGESFGDEALAILDGGGAGGRGSGGCEDNVSIGGGGGGAIQLSALTSVSIAGTINAGGGGGEGGRARTSPVGCQLNAGSGAGGGAGGAIFLEAPTIENLGVVAANGGGGGGGPKEEATADAMPGSDADASAIAATGGPGQSPEGGNGGNGATTSPATPGGQGLCANATTKVNGGGGGGGAGRIVMRGRTVLKGMTSPLANVITP